MADPWQIDIQRGAKRDLDQLAKELGDVAYDQILEDILDLQEDPLPPGHVRLKGTRDSYRIYTYRSLYRIVYRVLSGKRRILIDRIRPRGSAYSGLDRW